MPEQVGGSYSRRKVLATSAAAVTVGAVGTVLGPAALEALRGYSTLPPGPLGPGEVEMALRVNGTERALRIEPRVTLLDALRERLGMTGTKKGCDRGECGACTVLIAGRRAKSCLTLAIMQEGNEITTVEGLADNDQLHPMQEAFIRHDGFQCGFCTPGQIMSAVGLLAEQPALPDAEIREQMSGNLCRCSAYPQIVAAIREVRTGVPR